MDVIDTFAVLAEPRRREILGALLPGEASVGELVSRLGLSQPTVSKHLRVLKDGGLVSSRTEAQRRMYRIEDLPLAELDAWLTPYRQRWERSLDALGQHLDRQNPTQEQP